MAGNGPAGINAELPFVVASWTWLGGKKNGKGGNGGTIAFEEPEKEHGLML